MMSKDRVPRPAGIIAHPVVSVGILLGIGLAVVIATRLLSSEPAPRDGRAPDPVLHQHLRRLSDQTAWNVQYFRSLAPKERLEWIEESKFLDAREKEDLRQFVIEGQELDRQLEEQVARIEAGLARFSRPETQETKPPAAKKPRPKLRLVVEMASLETLPFLPLTVNLHLLNEEGEPISLGRKLDERAFRIEVSRPGRPGFAEIDDVSPFGMEWVGRDDADSIPPGGRVSLQTQLLFGLGFDYAAQKPVFGEHLLRFRRVDAEDNESPQQFTVRVMEPTGDDRQVFETLLKLKQSMLLGTQAKYLIGDGSVEFSEIDAEAKNLSQKYSKSAYARELRIGLLRRALSSPDDSLSGMARLRSLADAVLVLDRPADWRHAETLLVLVENAGQRKDWRQQAELLRQFPVLASTDARVPAVRRKLQDLEGNPR